MRALRPRQLMAAGLVDSFGLALGWTVFNLHAATSQGLGAVGLYNAAMLVGVGLSAPAAAWVSARLNGSRLLRTTSAVEAPLRIGTFLMLLAGAPAAAVAVAVTLTSVVAWTGYAAMRAELAALDRRATAITRYTVCIAGIEAAGAAAAALLPTGPAGTVTGHLLLGVVAFYGACLIPTFAIARNARVPRAKRRTGSPRIGRPAPALAAGFAVMLLASGPTLLSVALAAQLYGRAWVAASAAAFTAGSLLAPGLATVLERARLPAAATWPALGIGMIAGWIVAPVHVAGLLVAQALSGLCMTALEGTMDARVAAEHANQPVTAGLAWSAAARALGSSAAVAAAPTLMAATAVATFSAATTAVLAAAAVLAVAAPLMRKQRRAPSREARLRTRTPAALELVDPPRPQRATAAP